MEHIYEAGTVSPNPPPMPANPLTGYPITSGVPGSSTKPGAYWFYMVTEELLSIQRAANMTADPSRVDQVVAAILELIQKLTRTNNAWTAQRSDVTPAPFASTMTLDFSQSNCFELGALTSNAVLANPINSNPGQSGIILVPQDGIGGRLLAYGSLFEFIDGVPPTLVTTPYSVACLAYVTLPSGRIKTVVVGGGTNSGAGSGTGSVLQDAINGLRDELLALFATGAIGSVLFRSATKDLDHTAAPTAAGQVLTAGAVGTPPLWSGAPTASGQVLTASALGTPPLWAAPVVPPPPVIPPSGLGVGQTWQPVTGGRSLWVTYTNTTGKPIQAAVSWGGEYSSSPQAAVDGQMILYPNAYNSVQLVVPAGSTYSVSVTLGELLSWVELR